MPDAAVYLFGSRADDNKRGGDIDILVLSDKKMTLTQIAAVITGYFKKFGERKLDIVSFTNDDQHPFKKLALLKSVAL